MLAATDDTRSPQGLHADLMSFGEPRTNTDLIARMLASKSSGQGAMPARLGLSKEDFARMLQTQFPGAALPDGVDAGDEVDPERDQECAELRNLLLQHADSRNEETQWMAEVLIAGCMGGHHLWQDLGLWSRKDLTLLLQSNFPALAAKNDKDMKWKKFLYKQLCIAEGIYVCRSPSCEVCPDYSDCFGPED